MRRTLREVIENTEPYSVEADFDFSTSHVKAYHMDKDINSLKDRVIEDAKTAASTFESSCFNQEDIKKAVVDIFQENINEVTAWFDSAPPESSMDYDSYKCLKLQKNMGRRIGKIYSFDPEQGTFVGGETDTLLVCVERMRNTPNQIRVSTVFPVGNENTHRFRMSRAEDAFKNVQSDARKFAYVAKNALYKDNKHVFVSYYESRDHAPYAACKLQVNPSLTVMLDIYDDGRMKYSARDRKGERYKINNSNIDEWRQKYPKSFAQLDKMVRQYNTVRRGQMETLFPKRDNQMIEEHNKKFQEILAKKKMVYPDSSTPAQKQNLQFPKHALK